MKQEFIQTKKFRVLAIFVAISAAVLTFFGVDSLRENSKALTTEAYFYSNELGDRVFEVDGYGDLTVNLIRKDNGVGTGTLAFCLNKLKDFPSQSSIVYESDTESEWVWELDGTRVPTDTQVKQVQKALYAYWYVFPELMSDYGFESTNTVTLYHATQIAIWAILEDWDTTDVKIKEDVYNEAAMLEYTEQIYDLYVDIYNYATNSTNETFEDGITLSSVDGTITDYNYTTGDYIETSSGAGYYRSELMVALPNQTEGLYYTGDYAYQYEVTLSGAPEGTRIVNENGVEQTIFSAEDGVGLYFYVDVPLSEVASGSGYFSVNVDVVQLYKEEPTLWSPLTDTAYQTLGDITLVDAEGFDSVTFTYDLAKSTSQVAIYKEGLQLSYFDVTSTEYGDVYTPVYEVLPLSDASFTIYIQSEDPDIYFITGTNGETYVTGANLIMNGYVTTDETGYAYINNVVMDQNNLTTSYKVKEVYPADGFTLGEAPTEIVQLTRTDTVGLITNTAEFKNDKINFYFEITKYQEVVDSDSSTGISNETFEGAVFGVYANEKITSVGGASIPSGTLLGIVESDANGIVSSEELEVPYGYSYYVKELSTADNLNLDNEVYYFSTKVETDKDYADTAYRVDLEDNKGNVVTGIVNTMKLGTLNITKQTEVIGENGLSSYSAITDASNYEFKVYSDEKLTTLVATLTDKDYKNGYFTTGDLLPGTYYVVETNAPADYEISSEVYEFTIDTYETEVVTIQNDLKEYTYTLTKYDITSGSQKAFAGVTFDIIYEGNSVDSFTTLSDGSATFTLKAGLEYTLEERVPAGYSKVSYDAIEVVGGVDVDETIVVENIISDILGNIEIYKVDSVSKKAIAGVNFSLYLATDTEFENPILVDTTNEYGYLTFEDLAPLEYVLVETVPATGYLNGEAITVDMTDILHEDTIELTVENTKYYGDIEITKVNADTGAVLNGAVFGLYENESDDTPITKTTTDEDGVALFEDIPYGTYYIKEISAPAGYELSEEVLTASLTDVNKETLSLTFENEAIEIDLEIVKRDNDTDELLSGAEFELYKGNEYITTVTTDSDGIAIIENLAMDTYTLREVVAPVGYSVYAEDITLNLTNMGDERSLRVTVYNAKLEVTLPEGIIHVEKIDYESKLATDATFTLYDTNGAVVSIKDTVDGFITFDGLLLGDYTLVETVASEGYSLNETVYTISLTEIDYEQTIIVENKKLEVTIEDATILITKYDEDTFERLDGVTFNIYKEGYDGVYLSATTDENGEISLTSLENGVYTIIESIHLDGYESNLTEYTVTIDDSNRHGIVSVYNKLEIVTEVDPEVKEPVIEIPETGVEGNSFGLIIGLGCLFLAAGLFTIKKIKTRD